MCVGGLCVYTTLLNVHSCFQYILKLLYNCNGELELTIVHPRSIVQNPEADLKIINTGADPNYMAYQVRTACP